MRANNRPLKPEPCQNGEHVFYENYVETFSCSATSGCTGMEFHCRVCGWYINECLCGAENGASRISLNLRKDIEKRQRKLRAEKLAREMEKKEEKEKEKNKEEKAQLKLCVTKMEREAIREEANRRGLTMSGLVLDWLRESKKEREGSENE